MSKFFQSTLIGHSSLVSNCSQAELVSDLYAITFNIEFIKPLRPKKLITYRTLSQINLNNFITDICLNFIQDSSIPLIDIFNNCLDTTLNEHVPLKSFLVTERFNTSWYNDICANSKRNCCQKKNNRLLHITKSTYNKNCIINCNHNLKDM